MTTAVSSAEQSPLPPHPRDPGDAWVEAPTGERYWGRFGAAGLLVLDKQDRVLLQHRAEWSHHGGTWGLPGGARHQGESAIDGALREAAEEAGVPRESVASRALSVLDRGVWTYTTVIADDVTPFEPVISDTESIGLEWVPVGEVGDYPLHPGFASSWQMLQTMLATRPVVVVDAANLVGSTPNGWWRDRAGATTQMINKIAPLASAGIAASALELPADHWFPEFVVVLEGKARAAIPLLGASDGAGRLGVTPAPRLRLESAPGAGDDAIVTETARLVEAGKAVTVVSSDRELTARVARAGASARRVRWLYDLLD